MKPQLQWSSISPQEPREELQAAEAANSVPPAPNRHLRKFCWLIFTEQQWMQHPLQGALKKQVSYVEDTGLDLSHSATSRRTTPGRSAESSVRQFTESPEELQLLWAPCVLSCHTGKWTNRQTYHDSCRQPFCFHKPKFAAPSACLEESR